MPSNLDEQFQTLHEIARAARRNLADGPWDYMVGGTETETTLRRNRAAIDAIAFRPRVLRDTSKVDSTSTFMGRPVRLPVMLAPVGSVESFTPGGGATSAKASGAFGVPHMLSSACNPGLEATAAAADNYRVFQLYVRGDDAFVDDHVKRARDNGYTIFCMTVDSAHYSRRERDLDKRFVKPWRQAARGMEWQAALSWDQVKRFKDAHDIPLILKGIATAEDAAIACDHGVDGVYVSNHGGRQLDHGLGSLDVLPEVVRAVNGRAVNGRVSSARAGAAERHRHTASSQRHVDATGRTSATKRCRSAHQRLREALRDRTSQIAAGATRDQTGGL